MLYFKQRIIFYWELVCFMFAIVSGVFLTLVGVIGFFFSEDPLKGCFEFALYGPIIIFIAIKVIKPSKSIAT